MKKKTKEEVFQKNAFSGREKEMLDHKKFHRSHKELTKKNLNHKESRFQCVCVEETIKEKLTKHCFLINKKESESLKEHFLFLFRFIKKLTI